MLISFIPFILPHNLGQFPAIALLIPFVLSLLITFPFTHVKSILNWTQTGQIDKVSFLLLVATSILSVAALIVWGFWTDQLGKGAQMIQSFSHYPKWLILVGGIPLFALINAFTEEVVYRGVMQEALSRVFEQKSLVIALQASAFAAIHFAMGFPNGVVGYVMVLVYGIMLGYLRIRTNGMLAPYLAHVIADLAIGFFLYFAVT
ncbi:MAG: type II CAAX endopeptidase family protein [Desulfobacteraceae bacterium]